MADEKPETANDKPELNIIQAIELAIAHETGCPPELSGPGQRER